MKEFKVAQIVPVSHLEDIAANHYHMCLAHLVKESPTYTAFYRRMSDEGKFVLMDNGAAENSQLKTADLLEMYRLVNPTEIVIPDTLCNMKATLEQAEKFISEYADLPYRFMAVPQGRTIEEWCICANQLLSRYPRINSIGVSKFLNIITKDPWVRMQASVYVYELSVRLNRPIEIHLLGCDEGPAIVSEISREVPAVRGCDSAFAYIAAKAGNDITHYSSRPAGEIDFLNGKYLNKTRETLKQFEEHTGVKNNKAKETWE